MADKDTSVSAVLQTPSSAEPIKIVLNQEKDSGYGNKRRSTVGAVTLRFADDIEFNTCKRDEDDLYEAETTAGSSRESPRPSVSPSVISSWRESPRTSVMSSWRESSRPSASPSLLSSRPSYHSENDDGASEHSDELVDEVQQSCRRALRGTKASKRTEGVPAHYVPHAACMANPSDPEANALELEIAAAELKVAALRAEIAAKRARAGKNIGTKRPDGNRAVQPGSSIPLSAAVQASTCKYSMLSTSPCSTAPAISTRQCNTTVMLRNVPNDYTRDMVVELLESLGFGSCFDFVYAPFDFKRCSALGYAFVNFTTNEHAARAMVSLSGFCSWKVQSRKIMQVSWTDSWQGLSANIERYRNSPVMHPDVPERFKPSLYRDGCSIPFPPPTKVLSKPSFA